MSDSLRTASPTVTREDPPVGFVIPPWAIWGFALLVVAVLALGWTRHQVALSVVRQAEPFTALGFADPVHPVDCATGTATITLANREGTAARYAYTATLHAVGRPAVRAAQGTLTVADGALARVRITVGAPIPAGTALWITLDAGHAQQVRATCGRAVR
jgi:hypothetical protein